MHEANSLYYSSIICFALRALCRHTHLKYTHLPQHYNNTNSVIVSVKQSMYAQPIVSILYQKVQTVLV